MTQASQGERLYLGLDVGGTKCAALLGTAGGEVVAREQWPSEAERGAEQMIAKLVDAAEKLRAGRQVLAAGVSIGGPLDAARGVVLGPPNLPGWDRVPLGEMLREQLGLPVRVEHDAAACALAEHRWGGGEPAERLLYLTCGTGFGVGFVVDGQAYRGAGGLNMEVGHARHAPDGPEAFGKRGSMEAFCAGGSLGRLAAWMDCDRWPEAPEPAELAERALDGDAQAKVVLAANADAVGQVAAILGDLLRPDRIVLGSLARHLGDWWVERVVTKFREEVLPATAAMCEVRGSRLEGRLQDLSALVVAVGAGERGETGSGLRDRGSAEAL